MKKLSHRQLHEKNNSLKTVNCENFPVLSISNFIYPIFFHIICYVLNSAVGT